MSLISFEAEALKVSCLFATEAETADEIKRTYQWFRTPAEFEKLFRIIGFDSIKDEKFLREMSFRTTIRKHFDFRFRLFVIITLDEEENYYQNVFAPEFRRRNPGILMPNLQEQGSQIRQILTEQKAEMEIKRFLDNARRRAKIVILSGELR